MPSSAAFTKGAWHHVAGAYDGQRMTLFVDGKLAATSNAQSGEIRYPTKASYVIGAYRDDDEHYRMRGAVHEVAVYSRALSTEEIVTRYKQMAGQLPASVPAATLSVAEEQLAAGPWLIFTSPTTATVRWYTNAEMPSKLSLLLGEHEKIFESSTPTMNHEVEISSLRRNRVYTYHIEGPDGVLGRTKPYECDTFFNYSVRPVPADAAGLVTKNDAEAAEGIIQEAGTDRGIVLLYGTQRVGLAAAIVKASDLRVVMVDLSARAVEAVRKKLVTANVYGSRIEAHAVTSYDKLPFDGAFANIVIVPSGARVKNAIAQTMARPAGGVVLRLKTDSTVTSAWRRPALKGGGSWTHQYGAADNSAFGGETLGGASASDQLRAQWIGRPGPRAQADRAPRKPAPLAVNGRLFVQGLHRAIAVDAFNGTILWSQENPNFERFNMPRDSGNWCADEKFVWLAVGGKALQIEAANGKLYAMHDVVPGTKADWKWDWGYIARAGEMLVGTGVKADSHYANIWGNASEGWYDAKSGDVTNKIASDTLFARHASSGARAWEYKDGVILNSTITIANGNIHFVETRNAAVKASDTRRVGMKQMWDNQYLVSVDLGTGKKVWERPLKTAPGTVVFYMSYGSDKLVINASTDGNYNLYAYDAKTGKDIWNTKAPWFDGKSQGASHHGVHMSRPVIVGDNLFVRPWKFDLRTGKKDVLMMPHIKQGHGCGTYAATADSLIFRSGNIAMWNQKTGKKTTWDRLRPGCWLSTIPAQGMLLSPEAGGGCSCGLWLETSIGFAPISIK